MKRLTQCVANYFVVILMSSDGGSVSATHYMLFLNAIFLPYRYKISLLKPSTKALALSCKVSIRADNRGFLSLQYMIRNEDGQICFVEYYCCPNEEITEAEL